MLQRSKARRERHRRIIRRDHPPCALCGKPIDYDLTYPDPGEFTIDHIVPLSRGGADELENIQPAHRKCNRDKSSRTPDDDAPRSFVTDRGW